MKSIHARLLGCALGVSLLALGTEGRAQEVPPGQARQEQAQGQQEDGTYLTLRTPNQEVTLQVTRTFIIGPDIQLVRDLDEDIVQGRAQGRSVFLTAVESEVEGLVGSMPALITFSRERRGQPLRLEGNIAGSPIQLRIEQNALTGTLGPCTYDLERKGNEYRGIRVCAGSTRQDVSLTLPPGLLDEVSPMMVTALAILLGA
jgi:hypothetical protein